MPTRGAVEDELAATVMQMRLATTTPRYTIMAPVVCVKSICLKITEHR